MSGVAVKSSGSRMATAKVPKAGVSDDSI
jgi:hypothetical protein